MAGLDASIYQGIQPVQMPSVLDSAQRATTLSQLGMQNQQMQLEMQTQQAMRQAYANNVGPDGQLNRQGFLSDLGRVNPQAALQYQKQFNEMGKQQADTQIAQSDAFQKRASIYANAIDSLAGMSEADRAAAYKPLMTNLVQQGVIDQNQLQHIGLDYDPTSFRSQYAMAAKHMGQSSKDYLANQKTQTDIGKEKFEMGDIVDKRVQALKEDLDPNKARGGNMAKAQSVLNAADRLEAIYKQFPDGNIPKNQGREVAIAYAALLQGGSPAMETIKDVVPSSIAGDANAVASWLTNSPMGQDQQKFYQLLHESIGRERDVADAQVKTAQVQRLSGHRLLLNTNPEAAQSVLHAYGIEPENIRDGKYVPSQQGTDLAGGAGQGTAVTSLGNTFKGKGADNSGNANAASPSKGITQDDANALLWVKNNPGDPLAFQIRARLKAKGLFK
jgi:hypothetical protein